MKYLLPFSIVSAFIWLFACQHEQTSSSRHKEPVAAPEPIGGGCDGCDVMYLDMPHHLYAADTSEGWTNAKNKLEITGTVFQKDGETPAEGVLIYYWHANEAGNFVPGLRQSEAASDHGQLRGWLKTGKNGQYQICTCHPGVKPGSAYPAHIFMIVKEPALDPYFIDQIVFDGDSLLSDSWKRQLPNRGGSGVVKTQNADNCQMATRNIVLGFNIPGYPQ